MTSRAAARGDSVQFSGCEIFTDGNSQQHRNTHTHTHKKNEKAEAMEMKMKNTSSQTSANRSKQPSDLTDLELMMRAKLYRTV